MDEDLGGQNKRTFSGASISSVRYSILKWLLRAMRTFPLSEPITTPRRGVKVDFRDGSPGKLRGSHCQFLGEGVSSVPYTYIL